MASDIDQALDVAELARLLQAADPSVILLPPRTLKRVIKQDRDITGLGLQVPHRKTYVLSRDRLLDVLDDGGREAVLRGNAAALYGLAH